MKINTQLRWQLLRILCGVNVNSNDKVSACTAQGRKGMENFNNTQYFSVQKEPELQVRHVLEKVFEALKEKGYNPVNQIVGYVMSGDPTYITSHKNARSLIMKVERDELVEELLNAYIKSNSWE